MGWDENCTWSLTEFQKRLISGGRDALMEHFREIIVQAAKKLVGEQHVLILLIDFLNGSLATYGKGKRVLAFSCA